jgi:hypothetical protein
MKFLIYKEEEIDDKITQTTMNQQMIDFNERLLAAGVKLTKYTDGLLEPKQDRPRKNERFKGSMLQRNHEQWLKKITPIK